MALYALGDLHLSFSTNKPMDVFGGNWEGYADKLRAGLSVVKAEDTLVLCGDLSWGMSLEQSKEDFAFISSFPGIKLIVKGNHDYWWTTAAKMERFFFDNGLNGLKILHNNFYVYENTALCGTRGWFYEEDLSEGGHNQKIFNREVLRLDASLRAAEKAGVREKIVFLHYPPIYEGYCCREIIETMQSHGVKKCCYGHLHGYAHKRAVTGVVDSIQYELVSADYLNFTPVKILD